MNPSDTKKELKRQLEVYERRVKALEKQIIAAQEETKKATDMLDDRCDEIIKSIFEKPQSELTQHIKKQSTSSIRNTWIAAIIALLLTIATGVYFQRQNYKDILEYRKELNTLGKLIIAQNTIMGRIQSEMALQQLEDYYIGPIETAIRDHISIHGSIETKNDLSIIYKIKVAGFPVPHVTIDSLFRKLKVSSAIYSIDDFSTWDMQILALYSNWLKAIEAFEPDKPVQDSHRYFINYRAPEDVTNYNGAYLKANTYGELRHLLKNRIEGVKSTIERNAMVDYKNKIQSTR